MPLHWRERLHLLLVVVVLVWKSSAVLPWFGSIEKTANLQLHIRANQCHHICLPYPTLPFATYHVLFDFLSQLPFWEPLCFLHGKKLSFLLISSISPGIQQRGTDGLSPGRSWSLLQGLCFPPDHSGIHGTGRWHHQWRWNRTDVPTKTASVGQTYQKIAQTMWHDWCNMSQEDAFWEWFCMPLFWGRRHQVWTEHISWIFHQVVRRAIDLWTVLCGWSLYSTSREGQHSIHGQQWSQHEALLLNSVNSVTAPLGWRSRALKPVWMTHWLIRQSPRNNSQFFILFGQAEFSILSFFS